MQISISFDTSVDTKDAVMNVVAATFGAPIVEYSSDTATQPEILVPAVINDIGMTGQVHNIAADASNQVAAQSTSTVTTAFEVDSTGMPWDERIHQGGNDRQTKDGVWKRKRGVSPITRQAVEAELMAKLPAMGTPSNRVGIPEGGVLGGETPSPDEQLAWVNNTKMEPPALKPLPDYTEPAPRNADPEMTTIISREDINAALASAQASSEASAQQVQADVAGAQQAAAMAEAVHEQERARREAEAQQAQAMAQQAADAIAQAQAAQQAQQTPGRFATLMASTTSEELTTVIANEVSAVIGQQLLRLDDLAAIARELTGDEDAGASSFFSLIPLQGYVPRLVALLDQQLANS